MLLFAGSAVGTGTEPVLYDNCIEQQASGAVHS